MSEPTASQGAPQGEPVPTPEIPPAPPAGTEQTSAEPAATEEPAEPEENIPPALQKRFAKLTAQKYEARRQAEDAATKAADAVREAESLKATIAALKAANPAEPGAAAQPNAPADTSEAAIEAKAREIVESNRFNETSSKTYDAGKAKFPDFDESLSVLRNVGVMNKGFLDAVFEVGSAPEILHYLGQHPDEADRLRSLSPVKLGVEMSKLAAMATKPKPVSSAPAPITTIDGGTKGAPDFENMSTEERIKFRRAERAAARR